MRRPRTDRRDGGPGRALRPRPGPLRGARRLRARRARPRDPRRASGSRRRRWTATSAPSPGGWKMRVGLARILLMRPDALLLDEPTNHLDIESILWLEGYLKGYEGALVMTSHDREFMNRIVGKIVEIDGGDILTYAGDYDFYEKQRAVFEAAGRGAVRAAAGDAREGAGLHRALQGPRQPRGAGAVAGEEARQDREGRAPQAQARARLRLPPRAPLRRGRGAARGRAQGLRQARDPRRLRPARPPARALVRDGRQRRGQVDAPQARRRRRRARRGPADARRQRQGRLLRAARDGAARPRGERVRLPDPRLPQGVGSGRSAPSRASSASRATTWTSPAACSPAARRRASSWRRCSTTRRTSSCSTSRRTTSTWPRRRCWSRRSPPSRGRCSSCPTTARFLAALSNRVLELEPEGPRVYGGGYREYVAVSGHEAPARRG